MSEALGPQTFDTGRDPIFLGKDLAERRTHSDAVAEKIDTEVGALLGGRETPHKESSNSTGRC